MSLAWAVGEHLHNRIGARTLFATHYHELTGLAERLSGARNYTLAVKENGGEVVFLRRLVPGGVDRSYGVHVARLAGLPDAVVERAEQVMALLEHERATAVPSDATMELVGIYEGREPYLVAPEPEQVVHAVEDGLLREVIRELLAADIANMTPLRALFHLDKWQRTLRRQR
jgi:DNA mismatch repair protein MutS